MKLMLRQRSVIEECANNSEVNVKRYRATHFFEDQYE